MWQRISDFCDDVFPLRRATQELRGAVQTYLNSQDRKALCKILGIYKPRVSFRKVGVIDGRKACACYIVGSANYPIFIIDPHCFSDLCGSFLRKQVAETIRHEIGHAYLDSMGIDVEYHDEDRIEALARGHITPEAFISWAEKLEVYD